MGENPVWQFFLCGKKKEREKEKGRTPGRNASESNMLLPG